MRSSKKLRSVPAELVAVLPPLFFAGSFLIGRALRDDIPPFQMSFWRWSLALVIVLPLAWPSLRRDTGTIRQEWPMLMLLGVLGTTGYNCFAYLALRSTEIVNAALITSFFPPITFILAAIFLEQPINRQQWLGLALSISGAFVLVLRGDLTNLMALRINTGDALVLTAVTCWSVYTIIIKRYPSKLDGISFLTATIAFGVLSHLPLVFWEAVVEGGFALTLFNMTSILYLAVFPSVLAYFLWNYCVRTLGAPKASMFSHLMPIFSTILGVVILRETVFPYHFLGFAGVLGGIALATRARSPIAN